jgi:hypothetical protein
MQVALAADCGEPVSAPKYQVGDKWVTRNEKGAEAASEVVEFEGDYAKIKWATPWLTPDKEGVVIVDADRVIRKAIRPNGEMVTTQGVGRPFDLIGQKELDFPLQVGKKWAFTYRSAAGDTGWRNYRVLACDEISTPAGKFSALKIENEIRLPRWSGTYHFWYAPAAKASIKWKFPGGFGPTALDSELVRYELK